MTSDRRRCPKCGASMLRYNARKYGKCYSCFMNEVLTKHVGEK